MARTPTPETISAYLDGELDEEGAALVEAAVAKDPDLRRQIAQLRANDAALRAAIGGALREPVPDALAETVRRGFEERRTRRSRFAGATLFRIAASIAALLIAASAGYLLHARQTDRAVALALQAREKERAVIADTVNRALESRVSGQSVAWKVPETGVAGVVTPIRTYRSKSGHWCREYRIRTESGQESRAWRGLACRTDRSNWQTLQEFFYEP